MRLSFILSLSLHVRQQRLVVFEGEEAQYIVPDQATVNALTCTLFRSCLLYDLSTLDT